YQARLRSRFGRAWRRKAPVESLMPLRLARYGVPLAETAPAGLAAAGIDEPPIGFTDRGTVVAARHSSARDDAVDQNQELPRAGGTEPQPQARAARPAPEHGFADVGDDQRMVSAYQDGVAAFGIESTSAQFARWLHDQYGHATAAGRPLNDEEVKPLLRLLDQRHTASAENGPDAQDMQDPADGRDDSFYNASLAFAREHGVYPDAGALATYVHERDQVTGATGRPVTGEDLEGLIATFREREFAGTQTPAQWPEPAEQVRSYNRVPDEEGQASAGAGAHPARGSGALRVSAAIEDSAIGDSADADTARAGLAPLTTVDRYYLAWAEYLSEHGAEPKADQLSAYLASRKGMTGRGGKPVNPSTLRRYLLLFRVYTVWAEHRVHNEAVSFGAIAQECAARGITAQHNKPLTADHIAEHASDFERRWQALAYHHALHE
ncbi:hypothetical protein ACF09N_37915, partial [Streptomyces sp. NPDC014777]